MPTTLQTAENVLVAHTAFVDATKTTCGNCLGNIVLTKANNPDLRCGHCGMQLFFFVVTYRTHEPNWTVAQRLSERFPNQKFIGWCSGFGPGAIDNFEPWTG